ncbi:MAG: RNA-binding cell elongation regulator Jag/EloR [Armatimonadota bacterium]|nr:Jag N-terminal domain-containing protein [Armatimonadota bacterium]MCX7777041.1 Jag N-terminal domain-containing protein [Armatimonadota bacterium]MDW8024891.1 RNA-binding cell elongation regulator Jag/EloR [Armatimonadota bacterium]
MKAIEKRARTVEEAIEAALCELNVTRDEVEIEVLEESGRGRFNILGSQQARVRVTLKPELILKGVVKNIVERMGATVIVEEPVEKEGAFYINIGGADAGLIIGRNGATLDAMQVIVSEIVRKRCNSSVLIWVDADRYRERRWEQVRKMALEAMQRAKAERRRIRLYNLKAAERRIVHLTLQNNPDVITYSEGEEPNRVLVIAPADLGPRPTRKPSERSQRMQRNQQREHRHGVSRNRSARREQRGTGMNLQDDAY